MITKTNYRLTATPAVFVMPSCVLNVRDRHATTGVTKRHMGFHSWTRPEHRLVSLND